MKTETKQLRRSRTDRMVAGVCGGLGEFFGLSPLWFRIAFLIALIPGGVPGPKGMKMLRSRSRRLDWV